MGLSKISMVEEIVAITEEMMPILKEAGIEDKQLEFRNLTVENIEKIKIDFIRPALKWMLEIKDNEYKEVKKVYKLLSPEMWERYKKWEVFEDCREVILLKAACKKLSSAFRSQKRPNFFKKSKLNGQIKQSGKQHKKAK